MRTIDIITTLRYDPDARQEVTAYRTIAEHPVVQVGTLDPNTAQLGATVLAILRDAVEHDEHDDDGNLLWTPVNGNSS